LIRKKEFREDLWYRLNVFPIHIPPLRERRIDIPALVQYLIEKKADELKLPRIPEVTPKALDLLTKYDWPGNVRELQNVIERELIIHPKGPLTFANFDPARDPKESSQHQGTSNDPNDNVDLDTLVVNHIEKILQETRGRIHGKGGAAELLGINPSTLRNKMNKLGINYKKGD